MTVDDLDRMLSHWVREYGPGGLPSEREFNILQALIEHEGFIPNGGGYRISPKNTVGDQVERAVARMEQCDVEGRRAVYRAAAWVVRVNYQIGSRWDEGSRVAFLARLGVNLTRHRYYSMLGLGRGWLIGYFTALEK